MLLAQNGMIALVNALLARNASACALDGRIAAGDASRLHWLGELVLYGRLSALGVEEGVLAALEKARLRHCGAET
jgi:hypothetical protein